MSLKYEPASEPQVAVSQNMTCFAIRDKLECYALDNDYSTNGGGLWTAIPGLVSATP